MKSEWQDWIKSKLQTAFLTAVSATLNDEKARGKAEKVRAKFPGMPKDALAQVLIKRAMRKTMIEGAANGGFVTAAETVIAAPAPEGGQRPAAISLIAAALAADVAYTTKVQMQLVLEIGEIYDCPFNKEDEDDVWLIFKAALGIKGTERAGAYTRFIFTEAAEKQFRKFLQDQGKRRAAQEVLRRIAGKEVAKYLSEKVLLRLVWLANVAIGAWFNRWFTKKVGQWAKVRAKIRASSFKVIDQLQDNRNAAILSLPVMFLTGTAHGHVTDNVTTLYAQASSRLDLNEAEAKFIESIADAEDFEQQLHCHLRNISSSGLKSPLLNIAITAAAASDLAFNAKQHECLTRLSKALGCDYSDTALRHKIEYLLC